MHLRLLLLFSTLRLGFTAQTFVLSGHISDGREPLAFATVYIRGTSVGTNANAEGNYVFKLPRGEYEIVYRYVGYSERTMKVKLDGDKKLDVMLAHEGVALKEVVVKAGEDPANPIIRNAIRQKEYFRVHPAAYSCKAYIKGLQKIDEVPKNLASLIRLMGGDASDTSDIRGVVYFSESESLFYFRAPSDEKEIMYSSRVSGNNQAFSFNRLGAVKISFYDNLIDISGLSNRPFVSPLNDNSFFYYRFFLIGKISEGNNSVNKIKVVPRRTSDPCFSGHIYIQDSTWRITGADLLLSKEQKLNFVDTLRIRQIFSPVSSDSTWMPVSLNLSFDFRFLGFKGNGYFNAGISGYDLNPVFEKNFFNSEVLKIEEGANKKDSAYWNKHREIPLTEQEIADYRNKDSVGAIRETDRYKDSVDRKNNRFKPQHLIFGYNYTNTRKHINVSVPGIITGGINFNTVEGANFSYYSSISKSYDNKRERSLNAGVRYGFSNLLWGGMLGYREMFNPHKFSEFSVNVVSMATQFNREDPIAPLVNTYRSLVWEDNFMKLYRRSGVELRYFTELVNGVMFNSSLSYMKRDPLKNSSDYVMFDRPGKSYTSNDPVYTVTDDSLFMSNNAFVVEAGFNFAFRMKYISTPDAKLLLGSKYPRLWLFYRKAIPVAGAIADYDLLNLGLTDNIRLGLFGRFTWFAGAGYFLNRKQMYFMDYKHFLGNQTVVITKSHLRSFRLLPYYEFSSNRWYAEAHAEQHFNGLLLNKIPLLKKLNAGEVAGIHALVNEKTDLYYELNFGLENVLRVFRFEYAIGFFPKTGVNHKFMLGLITEF